MCGIAGLIHRGKNADVGSEMTAMLQSLKHRGPDSTGFALYGVPAEDQFVMRFKVAEQEDMKHGFDIHQAVIDRKNKVNDRLDKLGAKIVSEETSTEYAHRYTFSYSGDMRKLADFVEDIDGAEILSIGKGLELIKDLGDAAEVSGQYSLTGFQGTHAIGHTRMATESDVDIRSAHPYWAYPFNDVSVVHNGQLTNYWTYRRAMERKGHRFMSNCDSELIAVYVADRIDSGDDLESAMHRSVDELDGVFTYLVATSDSLGMAKDVMAAKPMVLYESNDFVGLASEEVAIRSIFPNEIETWDPYEGEVRVWQA
ncbi:MAG: glutamine amidotransferase [Gammaproteobacteria bacterium]|nr:class II glutamine amidotransferase [Gammaproteobacteria bacterium]MXX17605.1 glutamine amidotransferase [Gammaproteobacteria bacterium]MXY65619.1 glutamine amidotransferase [Gammaproteobacteria bacterium]MYG66841.1 glutamine amidotransferase [Gammaproteobacteria bacterium]MYH89934.1 glutamine amidotransferase [Gammaproteobacteria bacterium]